MGEELQPGWWLLFPAVFVGFWMGVCLLLSRIGGWGGLAAAYSGVGEPQGKRFRFASGRLGWTNYNHCLHFAAGPLYLHVSVLFLFRAGHPPFSVPWHDLRATPSRLLFTPTVDLHFAKVPEKVLRIPRRLAERIAVASGGQLRVPAAS